MIEQSVFLEQPTFHWAFLAHLGFNHSADPVRDQNGVPYACDHTLVPGKNIFCAEDDLRFDLDLWHSMTKKLAAAGCNLLVLDIGEGFRYESHPEIACRGALSKDALQEELFNLRMLGIEAVPKLDFSACHDAWMGEMRRMVSTTSYYRFCADLIAEICEVFSKPRLFHLGMCAETAENQRGIHPIILRQGEAWWHDLDFFIRTTMHNGSRPWIWSDAISIDETAYLRRMPRDVVQSVRFADSTAAALHTCEVLEGAGYEQIPAYAPFPGEIVRGELVHGEPVRVEAGDTASFGQMTAAAKPVIAPDRLLGYLQTVFRPMLPQPSHIRMFEQRIVDLEQAKQNFDADSDPYTAEADTQKTE